MSVDRTQRFTRERKCPVCGGCENDPRGKGKRCSGFMSTEGDWCHCSREELAGSIDMSQGETYAHKMHGPCYCGEQHGEAKPNGVEAVYPYTDESSTLLFEVVRKAGKRFLQRRSDGNGGHIWKLDGVRRVPYRLPELIASDPLRTVFVVEGEKDVASLVSRGEVATCNAGGAGKWHTVADTARTVLSGRDVIVIADKDEPGRKHASDVAASISGSARSVRVTESPQGKDISDYFAAGGTMEALSLILAGLPEWKQVAEPPAETTPEMPGDDEAPTVAQPFSWIRGNEIFEPLPPVLWVVAGIFLCPGRPFELVGYGYSGKTVAGMSMLLSVATGLPVWGKYSCKKGVALHFDHEVGRRGTLGRYQRLAFTDGITPDMVEDRLRVCCLPDFRLTDSDAEDKLKRECDGASVAMIDSFRAVLGGGMDENASDARLPIDKLLRVSETTGCSFVLLHHAGKGSGETEAKMAGRGSSAIFDAAGTVLKLQAEKHQEPHVTVSKAEMSKVTADASGGASEPFWLRIEDVPDDQNINPKAGLRCSHVEVFNSADDADSRASASKAEQVLKVLRAQGRGLSGREVDALVQGKTSATKRALEMLKLDGKVTVRKRIGQGGGWEWFVT
jgi:hypothetical protein